MDLLIQEGGNEFSTTYKKYEPEGILVKGNDWI